MATSTLSQLFQAMLGLTLDRSSDSPASPARAASPWVGDPPEAHPVLRDDSFAPTDKTPINLSHVRHPDGRMSSYPPAEHWNDWVEYDGKHWPRKVARRYTLVPTICFNCESCMWAVGLCRQVYV